MSVRPTNYLQFMVNVICLSKAVRVEVYNSDEILTERDYLAIGLCAGFLVLLYIFAMIVLIIMKKKQRRDARLREQFLNMPLPSGLGYKSSRILGLEQQEKNKVELNDEVRYSTKSKSFSQMEPKITRDLARMQNGIADKEEEKIYDITKVHLLDLLLSIHYQLSDFYSLTYKFAFYFLEYKFWGGVRCIHSHGVE